MKICVPVLLAALLVACSAEKKTAPAAGDGKKTRKAQVAAVIAKPMTLRQSTLGIGTVLPAEQVEIKTETAGRIAKIAFAEGQAVAKGALLVQLDDAELQANLAKAKAKLEYQRALFARRQKLLAGEALSQQDLESSQADLASAEADVQLLEAQLAKTRITAPFAGTLGLRQASPGAVVANGQILTTLMQRLPAKVEFSVTADQAIHVQNGALVQVRIAPSRLVPATVYASDGLLNTASRSLRVRAHLTEPGNLVPGSAAEVYISTQAQQGILVPPDALSGNEQGPLLYVLRGEKAHPVPVTVGTRTAESVQILKGLAQGDTVLCVGALNIRPEQTVNIVEFRQ